jgi:hypothetical protein
LGAQANSQGRFTCNHLIANEVNFVIQKWILGRVVRAFRTAENDKQITTLKFRQRESRSCSIDILNEKASALELALQGTEVLERKMPENNGTERISGYRFTII